MRGNRGGKRTCPKCLGKVPDGDETCPSCGHRLAAPGEVVPPPAWVGHEDELIPPAERPLTKYQPLEEQLAGGVGAAGRVNAPYGDDDAEPRVIRDNYGATPGRNPALGYVIIGVLLAAVILGLVMAGGTDPAPRQPKEPTAEAYYRRFQNFCAQANRIEKAKDEGVKEKDLDNLGGLTAQPAYNPKKVDHWLQVVSDGDTRSLLHVGNTIDPSTEVKRVDLIGCFRLVEPETLKTPCSYVDPTLAPLPGQPTPTFQVFLTRQRGVLDVYEPRTAKLLRSDPIVGGTGPCPQEASQDRDPPLITIDQRLAWDAWSLTHLAGGKLH